MEATGDVHAVPANKLRDTLREYGEYLPAHKNIQNVTKEKKKQ